MCVYCRYGRDRGVLLIGEFDAPGHANSWCSAYPELCPSAQCQLPMDPSGNLSYAIITALANETVGAFGSGIYHGGGDEVTYECWESSPRIKNWMTAQGFSSQQAYAYFLARTARSLPPATVPMFWQVCEIRTKNGENCKYCSASNLKQ